MAKDIAAALGYSRTADAVRTHCKNGRPVGVGVSPTLDPQTVIVPERDIYRLVMRSKLPSAQQFEEWVVGEVLPSIRKTGGYSSSNVVAIPNFSNPAEAARAWAERVSIARSSEDERQDDSNLNHPRVRLQGGGKTPPPSNRRRCAEIAPHHRLARP